MLTNLLIRTIQIGTELSTTADHVGAHFTWHEGLGLFGWKDRTDIHTHWFSDINRLHAWVFRP